MRKRLSNGRRLVGDVIHTASRMPLVVLWHDLDVSAVVDLRRRAKPRISWNALFMKAYSIVSAGNPDLRSVYVPLPWPHLYVHEANICMLTFSRDYGGENRLFWARFPHPEHCSLVQLQELIDHYQHAPVESIRQFRHQVAFAKWPCLARRWAWWLVFNMFPRYKCKNMGTFGMSLSALGTARAGKILGPSTTTLGVDPVCRRGISHFQLTFDHRVMDGKPALDVVHALRKALHGPIVEELRQMAPPAEKRPNRAASQTPDVVPFGTGGNDQDIARAA
jgi:hypothetical protein